MVFFSLTQGLKFWQKAYILLPIFVLQEMGSVIILYSILGDSFLAGATISLS